MTRSGRTVKAPKHVDVESDAEESPPKHKKKHVAPSIKCFHCSNVSTKVCVDLAGLCYIFDDGLREDE